ncbi:MAG: PDZ domain-containing protein [Roseivirga sp.]|nr:PDZ domain-containing protein [Roseivirga sp.]
MRAQSDYDCSTAQTLKEFLDERHIEPESLEGQWSQAVATSFILRLDPQGLLFTQEDFKGPLSSLNELESVIKEDACAFLNDFNDLLTARLTALDSVLNTIKTVEELNAYQQGNTRPLSLDAYVGSVNDLRNRWGSHIRMVFMKDIYLESGEVETSAEAQSAELTRLLEQEHCKLQKKLSLLDDESNFVSKAFFNAMAMAYDSHTRYYRFSLTDMLSAFFSESDESYGFKLTENEQGEIAVSKLLPGGPAWRSNEIHVGDVLLKMKLSDDTELDFNCISLDEVSRSISKKAAKNAELTLLTTSRELKTIKLRKEKVTTDENAVRGYVLNGEKKIGYISLPDFYSTDDGDDEEERGCSRDVARELIKLKREKIEGLIFDLRDNGGGSLREAVELLGIFIEEGPLTLIQRKDKITLLRDQNRGAIYLGPLVVLVNGQSASASELVASTLKDYNRALIVGDTTFGKAVGQLYRTIGSETDDGDQENPTDKLERALMKITTSRLFRLKGDSYQGLGVAPHIYVPDLLDGEDEKESFDPFSVTRQQVDRDTYFKKYPDFPLSDLQAENELRLEKNGFSKLRLISDSLRHGKQVLGDGFKKENFIGVRRLQQEKKRGLEKLRLVGAQTFEAQNHEFDKTIISMDSKKNAIESMTLKNLQNNIYIRNAYAVILDLIRTTD